MFVKTYYRNQLYESKFIDFDYLSMDDKYVYVGMFANAQTIARFSNVKLEDKHRRFLCKRS